jgi:spermidine synthase
VSRNFEELDYQQTPLGPVSLRRQRLLMLGDREIHEVKLGDDYLMTSLFHDVEVALARLGLAAVATPRPEVVVGGLGLGYTAAAVLDQPEVASLVVVEYLAPVLSWHRRGLVPLGPRLTGDRRCRFVEGDFFALAAPGVGFDPAAPGRKFDAVLLDIDHSPAHLLHPRHGAFYRRSGLEALATHLRPGGVFGLWSDDPPNDAFLDDLAAVFATVRAEEIAFPNPFLGRDSRSTVYVAQLPR